jgi:hypothetical protein
MSTTGCNCLSGVCAAFPFSGGAIAVTVILSVLLVAMIVVAVILKKKNDELKGRGSDVVYQSQL